MNSAAMLRVLEGSFQVEVIGWDIGSIASDEESRREALHRLADVYAYWVIGFLEGEGKALEGAFAIVN